MQLATRRHGTFYAWGPAIARAKGALTGPGDGASCRGIPYRHADVAAEHCDAFGGRVPAAPSYGCSGGALANRYGRVYYRRNVACQAGIGGRPIYEFSRAIYRELSRDVAANGNAAASRRALLASCETACVRLARDRRHFAKPALSLFRDVRVHFPLSRQARVYRVIERYIELAADYVDHELTQGRVPDGSLRQCPATTRGGTPCRREPVGASPYCPSHRHLDEGLALSAA